MVTLEVDGKTNSDQEVGDVVFDLVGDRDHRRDVDAQIVTIVHGDQTLTLRAGQVVVKWRSGPRRLRRQGGRSPPCRVSESVAGGHSCSRA